MLSPLRSALLSASDIAGFLGANREKRTGLRVSANRSPLGPKQHSMEKVFDRRRLRGAKAGVSSEFASP
jgi:hypothetical protein